MVPCRAAERFTRPMATNRWRQISELYDAALTKPPENRAAFLAAACSDEELRGEVASLLEQTAPPQSCRPARSGPIEFCRCWVPVEWARFTWRTTCAFAGRLR